MVSLKFIHLFLSTKEGVSLVQVFPSVSTTVFSETDHLRAMVSKVETAREDLLEYLQK